MLSECQDFRMLSETEKFLVQAYIIKMRFINHFDNFVPQGRVGIIAQHANLFDPPILADTRLLTQFTHYCLPNEDRLRESLNQAFKTELGKFAPRPQNNSTMIDGHTAPDELFNERAKTNPSKSADWLRNAGKKSDTYRDTDL